METATIRVGQSKTETGAGRIIPMNADLRAVFQTYMLWYARDVGEIKSEMYVFPLSRTKKPADPTQPVTSVETAWNNVRAAAGVGCRFHDLRHTAPAAMAEGGVPESTMLALAGHMSRGMLERYSQIRMAAKREAVEAMSVRKGEVSAVTGKATGKVRGKDAGEQDTKAFIM